jgi:hypothetical protein
MYDETIDEVISNTRTCYTIITFAQSQHVRERKPRMLNGSQTDLAVTDSYLCDRH